MATVLKVTDRQMDEIKKQLSESWQLNPNKYQFVGAYIKKFREKLGMPDLQRSDIHAALQSGNFRFQPVNEKGYYRKEDIEYALGPGLKSLKRYFGVDGNPDETSSDVSVPSFVPVNIDLGPDEEKELDSKSDMELASDELLGDQEVAYGSDNWDEVMNEWVSQIPFYERTNNRSLPVPLSETNARRVIDRHSGHGYAIISACRGESDFGLNTHNKKDYDTLNYVNKERTKSLQTDIQDIGFSYTPCYGGFIENKGTENEHAVYEKSFIVYATKRDGRPDFALLRQFAIDMCDKYNQDAVLVKSPDSPPAYYGRNGNIEHQFNDDVSINNAVDIYFTDLHKNTDKIMNGSSKPTRFSFVESYIAPRPQCYSERHIRSLKGEIFVD